VASGKGNPSNTYTKAAHEIEPTGAVAPGATIAVYSRLSPRALGDKFIVLGLIRHSPSKIPDSLPELRDFDSIGDLVKILLCYCFRAFPSPFLQVQVPLKLRRISDSGTR